MASIHSVAIGFWIRQGRIHESPAEEGASHLLEHMVFKGTERRLPRELAWEIERVGGSIDAYTTHEATVYVARVPANHLALAVDILADLAFHPLLRAEDLELEREVVLEEIAATEEAPEDVAFEKHAEFLYGGHPYGAPIIGTLESVSAMSLETLRALHARAYTGANLVVAAAGAVEHEELLDLVSRAVPANGTPRPLGSETPIEAGVGTRRIARPGGRQTHVVTGGLGVAYRDDLRHAVVVTTTALGGGMSSRLFQRVREELGLAYSVYSFHCFFATAGHVGTYVGTRPEAAQQVRDVLAQELEGLAERGLEPEELADTRRQLKGQILISLESPTTRMNRLASVALFDEEYRTAEELAARIDQVDAEQCAMAARLFAPGRAAILELSPE